MAKATAPDGRTHHSLIPMVAARLRWSCLVVAIAVASGCYRSTLPLPMIGNSSLSVGEWSGTTSQGAPIAFSVSAEGEAVTTISLGYEFNGCSGSLEFSELNISTAPDVMCFPGPCSNRMLSSRRFAHTEGSFVGGPSTQINGLFLPRGQARGQAIFRDYPGCGTATVEWSARRH